MSANVVERERATTFDALSTRVDKSKTVWRHHHGDVLADAQVDDATGG
jgi:hypothetical protein